MENRYYNNVSKRSKIIMLVYSPQSNVEKTEVLLWLTLLYIRVSVVTL